jgi:hypothetical protein
MTRIHQTWDIGTDGDLTVSLGLTRPLPAGAFDVLARLQAELEHAAGQLRKLLDGAS